MDLEQHMTFFSAPEDAFVAAAENARIDFLEELLSRGVDVNCRNTRLGSRALHRAASRGSVKTVEFLLSRGAEIESLDENELTPLAVACSAGKKKGSAVAALLLERGADASYTRASDGMTVLGFALGGRCTPEVLDALQRAGARMPGSGLKIVRLG